MESFSFSIERDNQQGFLRVHCSGAMRRAGFVTMVTRARAEAHRLQCHLLYDMRLLRLPDDIQLSELLVFVQSGVLDQELARAFKSASLVIPELLADEIWDIYGYASQLAGLRWEFFTDESLAAAWLQDS